MTVTGPAGVRRDAQSSSLQVDAETALWAIGRAVAIARLPVAHHLVTPQQTGECKVVTCEPVNKQWCAFSLAKNLKYFS